MSANVQPIFTLTPNCKGTTINAANTAKDGSGAITTLFTAGTNGSRVDRVTITNSQATAGANSASVNRIWISDTSGANYKLYKESAVAAVTGSNTAIGYSTTLNFVSGLILASGQLLGGTIAVRASASDNMDFVVEGGDY